MRVTDSLKVYQFQQNIDSSSSNLNIVQQQLATGKKLNLPSDNPAGVSQSLALRASLGNNAQYQTDATQALAFLNAGSGALTDTINLIQSARQIAVQGANSTQSPDSMNALSLQVDALIHQLSTVANQNIHGKYIFSGTSTQTAPFIDPDPATPLTPTAVNSVNAGYTAGDTFGGSIRINNQNYILSGTANSLADVNTAISGSGYQLSGPSGAVTLTSLTTGAPAIAQTADLSALGAYAGATGHGNFAAGTVTPGTSTPGHTYHGNTGSVTATIGQGDVLTLNTPGSATFTATFNTLEKLKSDLSAGAAGNTGAIAAVSNDIGGLDNNLHSISTAQASFGAKIVEVNDTVQRLTRAQGDFQASISTIEDVDLAQAYVQMQSAQNVYQASLVTTSKAFQYSLADYLH